MRRTIAFLPEYLLPWPAPRYLAKGLLVRTGRTLTPRALFSNSRRSPGPTPRTRRISLGTVICPLLVIRACFFKVKLLFLTLAQLSLLLQETSPCVYRSKREMINDTRHSVSRNHPFCEGPSECGYETRAIGSPLHGSGYSCTSGIGKSWRLSVSNAHPRSIVIAATIVSERLNV